MPPYMKTAKRQKSSLKYSIFDFAFSFRISFRFAVLAMQGTIKKVRFYQAFRGVGVRNAINFSRQPRYDRFDTSPYKQIKNGAAPITRRSCPPRSHRRFSESNRRFNSESSVLCGVSLREKSPQDFFRLLTRYNRFDTSP